MKDIGIVFAFGIMLVVPLVGVCMVICAGIVADRRKNATVDSTGAMVLAFGSGIVVIALISFGISLLALVEEMEKVTFNPVTGAAGLLSAGLALFVAYCGTLVTRLFSVLQWKRTIENESRVNGRLSWVRLFGWILILLPIGVFAPVMITGLLPLFIIATCAIAILINGVRARQGNLLWLLTIAVERNIPLADEVESFAETLWGKNRTRMLELSDRLRDGDPLATSLEELPGLVPAYVVTAVHVGEQTDNLSTVLRECAVRYTATMQQSSVRPSATWLVVYFWALITIMQLLVGFQMYFIVPKIKRIFEGFGTELPGLTAMLINAADSIAANFFLFAPLVSFPTIVLLVVGAYSLDESAVTLSWFFPRRMRHLPDHIVPALVRNVAKIFPRLDSPWLLRCLAATIEKGRSLTDGLAALSLHHYRESIRERIADIELAIADGEDNWLAMQSQNLINAQELAVLQSAQRVDNLPWAMREMAEAMERRRSYRMGYWMEFIRPVVVLGVGLMVAFICAALFMPLIKLLNDLS